MNVEFTVTYHANKVINDSFVGEAVVQWTDRNGNTAPKHFVFDTPFATRDEAVEDAKQRLVDGFAKGAMRPY
jgi:hypothetical protein